MIMGMSTPTTMDMRTGTGTRMATDTAMRRRISA